MISCDFPNENGDLPLQPASPYGSMAPKSTVSSTDSLNWWIFQTPEVKRTFLNNLAVESPFLNIFYIFYILVYTIMWCLYIYIYICLGKFWLQKWPFFSHVLQMFEDDKKSHHKGVCLNSWATIPMDHHFPKKSGHGQLSSIQNPQISSLFVQCMDCDHPQHLEG